jgi:hypothetical protein
MTTTWRVQGEDGTYVEMTDSGVQADKATQARLDEMAGLPVPSAFPAVYTAKSKTDPVWVFLAALDSIPAPRTITGTAPDVPVAVKDDDLSVVY